MCSQVAYMYGSVHISCKITIFPPDFFLWSPRKRTLRRKHKRRKSSSTSKILLLGHFRTPGITQSYIMRLSINL